MITKWASENCQHALFSILKAPLIMAFFYCQTHLALQVFYDGSSTLGSCITLDLTYFIVVKKQQQVAHFKCWNRIPESKHYNRWNNLDSVSSYWITGSCFSSNQLLWQSKHRLLVTQSCSSLPDKTHETRHLPYSWEGAE